MSTISFSSASPVIPLFPAERITRHLLITDYGTARQIAQTVVMVTGADGVVRPVGCARDPQALRVDAAASLEVGG